MLAPEARQLVLVERVQPLPGDGNAARRRGLQTGRHHQQRRLARARRAQQRQRLAVGDVERNAVQNVDRSRRARQCQAHVFDLDRRRARLFGRMSSSGRVRAYQAFQAKCVRTMQTLFKTILVGLAAILAPTMMAGDLAHSAAQIPQSRAQPVRMLAFGDSLTQGYGVPPGTEFPARLERALNAQGARRHRHQCRRLGRNQRRRSRADRLAAGRWQERPRRRHRRARRQ